ncbi:hypothetical protein [Variovorax saccharolyticus]|uniref:hypothetical protein n=1 Tax=Variovorax saccharolyticus TaxID=3053516 RepID=UPI002575356A|nr:hypothetical protein [Variovorax sp. J31P216]MDM0025923.1 hypothetical protein [Variovorax sp. J31P216]
MRFLELLLSCQKAPPDRTTEQNRGRTDTKIVDVWDHLRPSRELENQLFTGKNLTGYSGYTRRLALPPSAVLGQGYSTISNSLRGMGMDTGTQTIEKSTGGVTYELKLIRSHEELATTLSISASASISGAWGGASASYSMFRSTDFHSDRSYVLLTMTVIANEQHLAAYYLTSPALDRMHVDSRAFYSTYGDSFISHLVRGAQLLALMEFSSESAEEHLAVATSLSANFSAGGASFSQAMTSASKKSDLNIRVNYAQTGGGVGSRLGYDPTTGIAIKGGVMTLTPEELLGRIREFPQEVRSDDGKDWSAVLWGYASDYFASDNVPIRPIPTIPYFSAGWTLDDLGAEKLAVETRRNDIKGMLQLPSLSEAKRDELKRISEHLGYVSREIDRVGQVVVAFPLTSSHVQNGESKVSRWQGAGTEQSEAICPIGQGNASSLLACVLGQALVLPTANTQLHFGTRITREATTIINRLGNWQGYRFTYLGSPRVLRVRFRGWLHNIKLNNVVSKNLDWVVLVNDGLFIPPVHGIDNAYDFSVGKDPNPLLEIPQSLIQQKFTIEILMIGDSIGEVEVSKSKLEVFITEVS